MSSLAIRSLHPSTRCLSRVPILRAPAVRHIRQASSNSKPDSPSTQQESHKKDASAQSQSNQPKKHKTQAELDDELRQKMAGMSGDGGEAGVEYEDGVPVSMKRSVKNNMFRYI